MRRIYALGALAALLIWPGVTSAQVTNTYTYDDLGRLTSVSYPSGAKTGYHHDAANNRTKTVTALNGVINSPPICGSQTVTITGVPGTAPPITVTGSLSIIPCGDPDGDALTLISPASAPVFTLAAGKSYSYPITVSDGNGGTAVATITYYRQ